MRNMALHLVSLHFGTELKSLALNVIDALLGHKAVFTRPEPTKHLFETCRLEDRRLRWDQSVLLTKSMSLPQS